MRLEFHKVNADDMLPESVDFTILPDNRRLYNRRKRLSRELVAVGIAPLDEFVTADQKMAIMELAFKYKQSPDLTGLW